MTSDQPDTPNRCEWEGDRLVWTIGGERHITEVSGHTLCMVDESDPGFPQEMWRPLDHVLAVLARAGIPTPTGNTETPEAAVDENACLREALGALCDSLYKQSGRDHYQVGNKVGTWGCYLKARALLAAAKESEAP